MADAFGEGFHAATGAAHAAAVGLEAGGGIGEGDGVGPGLGCVLQEHGDQGAEGDVVFQAKEAEDVIDGEQAGGGGEQAREAQDAEVVEEVGGGAGGEAGDF